MTTIALLDGDIFAFEAAAAAEVATDWGDGLWTLHAHEAPAKAFLADRVQSLVEAVGADELIIALSDKTNFRNTILPTYKANRKGIRRPMLLPILRDYLRENYEVFERPGLEGDDVLGILSTWDQLKGTKVIVTKDKDFNTIPCNVYFAHHPDDGIKSVSEEDADYFHMVQTLTGDTTDNYKGCPGCGPVKADKVLTADPDKTLWEKVVAAYVKAGLCEEEALVQARCARILRACDYDFKKKEPILWTP